MFNAESFRKIQEDKLETLVSKYSDYGPNNILRIGIIGCVDRASDKCERIKTIHEKKKTFYEDKMRELVGRHESGDLDDMTFTEEVKYIMSLDDNAIEQSVVKVEGEPLETNYIEGGSYFDIAEMLRRGEWT